VSANGVWRCLRRHGLNTRSKRLSLVAGYRGPYEPPREPEPEPHIEVDRPGELIGLDCFYVGRLRGTDGAVWQLTAIDCFSSFAWAELVICREGNPTAKQTSKLARQMARELKLAGWRLERVLADNGNEFKGPLFHETVERLGARVTHIHAGRPQTTVTSRRCTRRSSRSAGGRPSPATSTHASEASGASSSATSPSTTATVSTTAASRVAASPPTSSTVPARWRRDEPKMSAHLGGCPF
jgi:transposase InsO family protein